MTIRKIPARPFIPNKAVAWTVALLGPERSRWWREVDRVFSEAGVTASSGRIAFTLWRLGGWQSSRATAPRNALHTLDDLAAELAPPAEGPRLVGDLRLSPPGGRRQLFDEMGLAWWRFASWFPALRIYRDDLSRARAQLDRIGELWQGVRVFAAVGGATRWGSDGNGWRGREVLPADLTNDRGEQLKAWPDYDEILSLFLDDCVERGIRVHLTNGDLQYFFPDGRGEPDYHADLGRQTAPYGDTVALYEPRNESWQNGYRGDNPGYVAALADAFRRYNDAPLIGLSAPRSQEEPDGLNTWRSEDGIILLHGTRHTWVDATRRAFNVVYEAMQQKRLVHGYVIQGEPTGTGPDVFQPVDDPRHLFSIYMAHAITQQGTTWFGGPSIRYRRGAQLDDAWGFSELPRLFGLLPGWLVQDQPRVWGGHRPEAIITAEQFEDRGEGPHRVDQAVRGDGAVVALVYGAGPHTWRLRSRRRLRCRVLQATGETVIGEIGDGERFEHPILRNANYATQAAVIIGEPV